MSVVENHQRCKTKLREGIDPITALYCLYHDAEPGCSFHEQIKLAMRKQPHVVYEHQYIIRKSKETSERGRQLNE